MKNKLFLLCLCTALPGCSSYFDEQYDLSSEKNKLTKVIAADDAKTRPYQKYNEAFLGKRVEYSAKKQQLLTKNINIESYEAIDLKTLLDTVSVQTGISYRINSDIPGKEAVALNDNWQQGRSVSFDGTFEEFMRYVSSLYDVNPVIDNNNVLVISVYETYVIKLDFYGQNNKFEAALDLSGNEATSDGGLTAKSEYKFESTFWDDVKDMADKYVSTGVYNIFKYA
jgi:toxin co-regulated pilus biosynthesis outer membrane protein C